MWVKENTYGNISQENGPQKSKQISMNYEAIALSFNSFFLVIRFSASIL